MLASIIQKINIFAGQLQNMIGVSRETLMQILATIIILILFFITHNLITRILKKNVDDTIKLLFLRRLVNYTISIVLIIFIVRIWYKGEFSLTTFLGLISAALTFVMKDVMLNIAGWIYITWKKPFKVGDRIKIGECKGDIMDVGLMATLIAECGMSSGSDASSGRVTHVPNSYVFTYPIINSTLGFNYIWDEIPIVISFESNWKKAKKTFYDILLRHTIMFTTDAEEQIKQASKEYLILYKNLNPTVYTNVLDSGVQITLRYLIKPRRKREMQEKIWEDILSTLSVNTDIELAYPTYRIYDRKREQS